MKLKDLADTSLFDDLRDPDFAAQYLEEVLKDGSTKAFFVAVRNVVKVNGGMQGVANRTKLGRESLYKTLSEEGNPRFCTMHSILEGVGLRFSVTPNSRRHRKVA